MADVKVDEAVEKKTFAQAVNDAFKELGETFVAFVKAPKALWGINVPYIIEGLVYFGILTILGKFCSENVALTDPQAGWVYSFVTGGITFAMLILGGVSDKLGVRVSLILAFSVMFIGNSILIAMSLRKNPITMPTTLSLGSPNHPDIRGSKNLETVDNTLKV